MLAHKRLIFIYYKIMNIGKSFFQMTLDLNNSDSINQEIDFYFKLVNKFILGTESDYPKQ